MIKTDILIIGAGPTGLFTVFEAGLLKMKCHILDSLTQPGGQCIELYPKKPIYDIPGYPEIIAGDLIENLLEQIKPFQPSYTLGETALNLDKLDDGSFKVTTDKGTEILAKIIAIAGGLGTFTPRKPNISNISDYENLLNEVIDAKKLIKKYIPELNDHDELFFVEFILWGLESYNKLSILRTNNGIEYKDPFNNFINKI